jgi:L-glutamine:2-deoxy-scyllo-inosose/3-amino-2,3-dideoxy-scyllo-inosose aminotransferase
VAQALSAELGMNWWPPDPPLQRSLLMRPQTKRRFAQAWTEDGRRRATERDFPGCERYAETTLLCHHSALLGDRADADADDIVRALDKIRSLRDQL